MKKNKLYQISSLAVFENKGYDGIFEIKDLGKLGNTGFGTFDQLNGEMILLDGKIYRAFGDCLTEEVKEERTPFASLGFLQKTKPFCLTVNGNKKVLEKKLDERLKNKDAYFLAQISGLFDQVNIHSVWPQKKPYEALSKIVKAHPEKVITEIQATLVGIYCPKSAKGLNVVGWHFHFLSEDKKIGGHVNDLFVKTVNLIAEKKESLEIYKVGKGKNR